MPFVSGARRTVRTVGVASTSLLLVGSAAAYALAPAGDALAARVTAFASKPGHQKIAGRIEQNGHPIGGETVKIEKVVNGHTEVVKTIEVTENGRFSAPVNPGNYKVVISKGNKHVTEPVTVKPGGGSKFVGVTVTHHDGGFGIAPVIFNY